MFGLNETRRFLSGLSVHLLLLGFSRELQPSHTLQYHLSAESGEGTVEVVIVIVRFPHLLSVPSRCLLSAGLQGPLDAPPPSGPSPQLSAQGEGPRLGESSISILPAPPGGLKVGETGETDLLWVTGEEEQEVRRSCRC